MNLTRLRRGGNRFGVTAVALAMLWLLAWFTAPSALARAGYKDLSETYARTKGAPVPEKPDAPPNEVLVKLKSGTLQTFLARPPVPTAFHSKQYRRKLNGVDWHLFRVQTAKGLKAAIEELRADPDVLYAEPNYRVHAFAAPLVPNDPRFDELWGMINTGQSGGTSGADIHAPEAWSEVTSSSTLVAVIDTGVDRTHPDLAPNMWVNLAEVNGVLGQDDDHNGYADDYYGWDFAYDNNDTMDREGHGTHVSGTIGAVGNNGVGVTGVCWNVKILAVKFMDDTASGTTSDAVDSINYAVQMGAKVLNNSWGGGAFSQALKDAITAANTAGVLFIAAAGNESTNSDFTPSYPASYDCPNVIAVAASTTTDGLAPYSDYGATSVDLAAPGGDNGFTASHDILSTTPNNTYDFYAGTSMATPHVAGACALIWGAWPTATSAQVRGLILDGVDAVAALSGSCVTGGRLNVARSVSLIPGRNMQINSPGPGEGFEAGSDVPIRWTAVGTGWQAGEPVSLAYSPDNGANWIPVPGGEALAYSSRSFVWNSGGLTPGSQYLVRVTANADAAVVRESDAFSITGPLDHFDLILSSPQYDGRKVRGTCLVRAKDASGRLIGTIDTYNAAGRFPVTLSAPNVTIGGLGGSGNALSAADFLSGVADLRVLKMTVDTASVPLSRVFTATSADGKSGAAAQITIAFGRDFFTQEFDSLTPFDLSNRSVQFIPDGSANKYTATITGINALPTDPNGAGRTVVQLTGDPGGVSSDDNYSLVPINGKQVSLYGTPYSSLYVGSNGYITFGAGDTTYTPTAAVHFSLPRIAPLFQDFSPTAGQISYRLLADRVAITYNGVSEYDKNNSSTFQVELFFTGGATNGWIRLSYLNVAATKGIAGLSAGAGIALDYDSSDLSGYTPSTTTTASTTTTTTQPPTTTTHASTTTTAVVSTTTTTPVSTTTTASTTTTTTTLPPPTLAVLDPNDNTIVREVGRKYVITWASNASLSPKKRVKIELFDGVSPPVTLTPSRGVLNDGRWRWKVSSWKYPHGDNYRIRVSTLDGSVFDESDNPFAIGVVTDMVVNSGPAIVAGNTAIPYNYTCIASFDQGPSRDVTALARWRLDKAGDKYASIKRGGLLTTKAIPADTPCQVTATYGGIVSPQYPVMITLPANPITVTSPDASDLGFEVGQHHTITWNCDPALTRKVRVKIALYDSANNHWDLTSPTGVTNDGRWTWKVGAWYPTTLPPGYPHGADYRIRVSSTFNDAIFDESDNPFAIGVVNGVAVAGPGTVAANSVTPYTCIASYDYGPPRDVTALAAWKLDSTLYATIANGVPNGGKLTTRINAANQSCQITATYKNVPSVPAYAVTITPQ